MSKKRVPLGQQECPGDKLKSERFKGKHEFIGQPGRRRCLFCEMPEQVSDLTLGDVFYSNRGIQLVADGFEQPFVTIKYGNVSRTIGKAEARELINALEKVAGWTDFGDLVVPCDWDATAENMPYAGEVQWPIH